MGDEEQRRRDRAARGDVHETARALRSRLRAQTLSRERLELGLYLGDEACALALDQPCLDTPPEPAWPRTNPRAYRDPRLRPHVDRLAVWLSGLRAWGRPALARALVALLQPWLLLPTTEQDAIQEAALTLVAWLEGEGSDAQVAAALAPLKIRWQREDDLRNGLCRWGERCVLYASADDVAGQPLPALASPAEVRARVRRTLLVWALA